MKPKEKILEKYPRAVCKKMKGIRYEIYLTLDDGPAFVNAFSAVKAWQFAYRKLIDQGKL